MSRVGLLGSSRVAQAKLVRSCHRDHVTDKTRKNKKCTTNAKRRTAKQPSPAPPVDQDDGKFSFFSTEVRPTHIVEPDPPPCEKIACSILSGATDQEVNECANAAEQSDRPEPSGQMGFHSLPRRFGFAVPLSIIRSGGCSSWPGLAGSIVEGKTSPQTAGTTAASCRSIGTAASRHSAGVCGCWASFHASWSAQ